MELREVKPGLYTFLCEYEDRFTPKEAGFTWHAGDRCRRKDCPGCKGKLDRIWYTGDLLTALNLLEYAEMSLRDELMRLAEPFAEDRVKAERVKARAAKIAKLLSMRSIQASFATDAKLDVPVPEGLAYLPYQRAAIAFALGRDSTLIADEMGLGKTIEAIGVINAQPDMGRVLIVCPASLKLNWKRECERWLVRPLNVEIAEKRFPAEADVLIINYERLGKFEKELAATWDLLIVDECHYAKNREAKRTKRLFAIEAERKLFLTGTPILNRPIELHGIAGHLAPLEFGDFWKFARRYCAPVRNNFGWDFNGAANLDELHERLRGSIMIRRTKAEVLPDLPPKRRQVIEFSSAKFEKLIARETEAWETHSQTLAELRMRGRESEGGPPSGNARDLGILRKQVNVAFGELAKLRQETALAKVPLVVEHVRNALEASPKVVLFAHHRDVVAALAESFGETAVTLTGGDSLESRQASVDRFQEDPSCTLFVGSIMAAGVGLTLTAAAHVVFAEMDWVPANLTQAEDRTHRIGQEESVLVQHLVLEKSLDARMVRTLIRKQRIVDKVVSGEIQTELFDEDFAERLIEEATSREGEDGTPEK